MNAANTDQQRGLYSFLVSQINDGTVEMDERCMYCDLCAEYINRIVTERFPRQRELVCRS